MKTLVLGGAGMLGHKVVQRLARTGDDLLWTLRGEADDPSLAAVPLLGGPGAIEHVDATHAAEFDRMIWELRPDIVVNCLGVIKQRAEAIDEGLCRTLNAELPHRLASLLATWNGRLIHISTDCVFDGARGAYTEDDAPNATDIYGRTKAEGEVITANAVTLRTSLIGRELKYHKSLLDWLLSQNGATVRGFCGAVWSGVTTLHLADLIARIIQDHASLNGLFQVSSGAITKYDLLLKLREAYRIDVEIQKDRSFRRDLSLIGTKLERAIAYRCPPMDGLIQDLAADTTHYPVLSATT